jgi:outer membrane receptor for ferrienterochelin and colicins
MIKRFTLLISFLYLSIGLYAQEPNPDLLRVYKNLTLEELMEVEVTSVSKSSEKLFDAPQNILVIQSKTLIERGYTDLEQVFHDLPGFDISRGYGTEYSQIYQRGYRSKNTDRTLVLVDGVEVNDLWSNSAWISRQHALSNIERIEVIYGPSSTMYGANAFAGVVSIITKNNDKILNGKSFGVSGEVGGGSWNTYFADITTAGKYKDASFQLTGRYYFSEEMDLSSYDDWDYDLSKYDRDYYADILGTQDDALINEAMALDQQNYYNDPILNNKEIGYSNTTKDYYLNGKLMFRDFTFGFQTYKITEGYGGWYRDDFELGPKNGGTWGPTNSHLYVRYDGEINEKLSFSSFTRFKIHQLVGSNNEEYFYSGYMNGQLGVSNLLQLPDTIITYNNQSNQLDTALTYPQKNPGWSRSFYHTYSQQLRSELKFVYQHSDKFNAVGGLEYRQSYIQGDYLVGSNEFVEETAFPKPVEGGNHFYSTDVGLFVQASYFPTKDLNIIAGGRVDHNSIRKNGGYGHVFTPKFALIYSPSDFVFKGIYTEAYKDAGYWTKYGTTPGRLLNNPTLEPEKVQNLEVTASWQANSNLYIDVSAYNSMYSNVIGTADVTYISNGDTIHTTQHQPLGSIDIKGVMSRLNYKFQNYTFYLNYTYTLPYNTSEDEKVRVGDIASHQINGGINVIYFDKLNINLRGNWVGEKLTGSKTTVANNPLDRIDPYLIFNASASYRFYENFTLQLIGNNLLDTEYFHPGVRSANGTYYASRIPQYERHFFLRLLFDF